MTAARERRLARILKQLSHEWQPLETLLKKINLTPYELLFRLYVLEREGKVEHAHRNVRIAGCLQSKYAWRLTSKALETEVVQ